MTRAERQRRAFPAYYACTLLLSLGAVQVAKAPRAPLTTVAPVKIAASAVMERPPKPQVARPARSGSGGDGGYTLERCATMSGSFADACLAAVARAEAARDPEGGLVACARIAAEELRFECIADVAEGHARVDVGWSKARCETIPQKKWRDQCVFGIANAFALVDVRLALQTCEESGRWRPYCRHDVNGERATVDPEGAIAYCIALPRENQPTCWHGLGKYIGRVDEAAASAWCAKAPLEGDLLGQCFHGLGWAAAERDGAAAADRCAAYAGGRDSCILGVAYQQKQFDPESAATLCNKADAPTERAYCQKFVAGGTR